EVVGESGIADETVGHPEIALDAKRCSPRVSHQYRLFAVVVADGHDGVTTVAAVVSPAGNGHHRAFPLFGPGRHETGMHLETERERVAVGEAALQMVQELFRRQRSVRNTVVRGNPVFGSGLVRGRQRFLYGGARQHVIGKHGFRAGTVFRRDLQSIAQIHGRFEPLLMSDGPLVVVNEEPRRTDGPLLVHQAFIVNRSGYGVGGAGPQFSLVLDGRTKWPQIHARRQAFADMFRFWRIEVIARIGVVSYERVARICSLHRADTNFQCFGTIHQVAFLQAMLVVASGLAAATVMCTGSPRLTVACSLEKKLLYASCDWETSSSI